MILCHIFSRRLWTRSPDEEESSFISKICVVDNNRWHFTNGRRLILEPNSSVTGFIVLSVPHVVFVASSLCCLWLEVCKWDVTPQLSALFTSTKVTWVPKLCRQSVWCSELTHVSLCQCDIMHLPGSQEPPAMEPLLVFLLCQWFSLTLINCEVYSNSKGLLMKKVHKYLIRGCRGGKKPFKSIM